MEIKQNIDATDRQTQIREDSSLNSIDLIKLRHIIVYNWIWIVVILLLCNTLTYLYIRYTKPLYSSESILKLDVKSEAGLLGFQNPMEPDIKGISGEIEILKSRLFASKIVDAVDMGASYYHPGSYLYDERYGNSPFEIKYQVLDPSIYDKRVDLEIIDDETFDLRVNNSKSTHRFDQPFNNTYFSGIVTKTQYFEEQKNLVDFFFILNSREKLIDYFQTNTKVEPVNFNANTIRISLTDYNKYKARSLLKAIDTIYLQYTKAAKNKAVEQKLIFLENQMSKTKIDLELYEEYFEKFTIENRTTDLSKDLNMTIGLLNQLDSQRFKIRNSISALDLASEQLASKTTISLLELPKDILLLVQQYNTLEGERELKLESYNQNTQVVQQLENKINQLNKTIKSRIKDNKENLLSSQDELSKRREILEDDFADLPSMGTSYNKNRRLYSLQEEFYFSLINTKMELEIARAGTVTDFVVLSPASLPSTPIKPQKIMIYSAGMVAGFLVSFLFIAVSYLLDDKISNSKELERLLLAPLLGVVPRYKSEKLSTTRLVVSTNPKSAISESLRSIRTNMEFMSSNDKSRKVISITSTVSGEGKTFITANLGAIFAYSGLKVVVVDLDMRRPKIHLAFGTEKPKTGISTVLINKSTVNECIQDSEVQNLCYICAGPTPPNPSELILGETFDIMVEELKSKFDIVILDTPPVGIVTDGILAMKKSDLPIYVVRADYSKKAYLKTVHDLIENNKFKNLSVILNSTSISGSYGYKYSSNYYEEEEATSTHLFKKLFKKRT